MDHLSIFSPCFSNSAILLLVAWYWTLLRIKNYLHTFQPKFFIPAMLTGTINFYHFLPLSVTLICLGVTRLAQSWQCKICWLHFVCTIFSFYVVLYINSNFKLNIMMRILIEISNQLKRDNCCFCWLRTKKKKCWMHSVVYELTLSKNGMVIDTIEVWTPVLDVVKVTLTII